MGVCTLFSLFAGGQRTEWDALISTHAEVSASALTDPVAKGVATKIKWKMSKWGREEKNKKKQVKKARTVIGKTFFFFVFTISAKKEDVRGVCKDYKQN